MNASLIPDPGSSNLPTLANTYQISSKRTTQKSQKKPPTTANAKMASRYGGKNHQTIMAAGSGDYQPHHLNQKPNHPPLPNHELTAAHPNNHTIQSTEPHTSNEILSAQTQQMAGQLITSSSRQIMIQPSCNKSSFDKYEAASTEHYPTS